MPRRGAADRIRTCTVSHGILRYSFAVDYTIRCMSSFAEHYILYHSPNMESLTSGDHSSTRFVKAALMKRPVCTQIRSGRRIPSRPSWAASFLPFVLIRRRPRRTALPHHSGAHDTAPRLIFSKSSCIFTVFDFDYFPRGYRSILSSLPFDSESIIFFRFEQ